MGKRGLGGFGAAATSAAAAVALLWQGPGRGEPPARPASASTPAPAAAAAGPGRSQAVRGAGSCSATACHGGTQPRDAKVLRDEHTTWVTRDKHAFAYRVLTEPRSDAMVARLPGAKARARDEARCLACHATPVPSPDAPEHAALVRDGVGCEACHGPAGGWIAEHTLASWPGQGRETEARTGMVDTVNLVRRARVCAGCHVGAPARDGLPARDVNHDLIAAGHPRLYFEFSAYLTNTAHHWRDKDRPDAAADFPARAWAVGRAVTAQAALDLLRDRAVHAGAKEGPRPEKERPWPEFAETGCFSCHHDLRDDAWRARPRAADAGPPGLAPWGTWHYPLLESLAAACPGPEAAAVLDALAALRELMGAPSPDPAKAAAMAGAASDKVGLWVDRLAALNFDARLVKDLDARVTGLAARGEVRSWDEATQRYLALVPLSQALTMLGRGPDRTPELSRAMGALKFKPGYNSPKSFDPGAAP